MENGNLLKTVKATEIVNWLKEEFKLGHGHAMAIYATFKGKTGINENVENTFVPTFKILLQWW